MSPITFNRQTAIEDFRQAHRRAMLQQIVARLTGKSVELLSYEEVLHQLRQTGHSARGRTCHARRLVFPRSIYRR